jgi:hypothetical protein
MSKVSAKMPKRKKSPSGPKKPIDTFSEKKGPGRPKNLPHDWVIGRAENYRTILAEVWPELGGPLSLAETTEQVIAVFEDCSKPYAGEFVPRRTSDILALIHDPDFPKTPKARIGFLADSLAGRPSVELRTSRDICGKGRATVRGRSAHKIIRREFYIECSCGYEGPARDNACRKCGAIISMLPETMWGDPGLF